MDEPTNLRQIIKAAFLEGFYEGRSQIGFPPRHIGGAELAWQGSQSIRDSLQRADFEPTSSCQLMLKGRRHLADSDHEGWRGAMV